MVRRLALAVPLVAALAGCATSSMNVYEEADVGRVMETTRGTVVSSRPVDIRGENTGVGSIAGSSAGALIGFSTVGRGDTSIFAGVVGALVGATVGYVAEQLLTSGSGTEYTVRTEDGRTISIVQNDSSDDPTIAAGTPVIVQFGTKYSRIIPEPGGRPATPGAVPGSLPGTPLPAPEAGGGASPGPAPQGPLQGPAQEWKNPDLEPPIGGQPAILSGNPAVPSPPLAPGPSRLAGGAPIP